MGVTRHTELLIIGAGPYGLAMALHARASGIPYLVVGKAMEFWVRHMPRGMFLRTPYDWSADRDLAEYLRSRRMSLQDITPVPLDFFVHYVMHVAHAHPLEIMETYAERLILNEDVYLCQLTNGNTVRTKNVVVATGYYPFRVVPEEYQQLLPQNRFSHAADLIDFQRLRRQRCMIIGGRQSAFEWAALLKDVAREVIVVHRHDTPAFKPSDWSWVYPFIDIIREDPGWFRRLPDKEKKSINDRFWAEGRLQLEDWLLERVRDQRIKIQPNTTVTKCAPSTDGALQVTLNDGQSFVIDHLILATGYKVDIQQLSYIRNGNVLGRLARNNGFPALDDHFQSSLPGLYFTGIHAVADFGPFLFFVAGSFMAAEIIGKNVLRSMGLRPSTGR